MHKYLIIATVLMCILVYVKTRNNTINKIFGIAILTVSSGSMEPELSVNDIIVIKSKKIYEIGDIVTYNVDNKYLVTHRIVDINREGKYILKGDNNSVCDDKPVTYEEIEGKVIVCISNMK